MKPGIDWAQRVEACCRRRTKSFLRTQQSVVFLTIRAAPWLTSSDTWPGLCALTTCSANASSRDGGASGGNGIMQIEQRTAPWYSIKCGCGFVRGMSEVYAVRDESQECPF